MATGTAWYNLTKPASNENYSVGVWNTNLDMIDAQMHQNETDVFGGATSLANGTVGNVPAPTIADKDKYLKGDGTWGTPSGGGGGSTVTITPTLSSGTKIADYSIDGVSDSLYAPSGGGGGGGSHTYSTTEQIVGTWIDGSDVWERTINIEEATIHGDTSFTIDIETNIGVLIEHSLMYRDIAFLNGRWNPLDGFTEQVNYDMYYNRLFLEGNGTLKGYFAGSQGVVTICGVIRYTKVTQGGE